MYRARLHKIESLRSDEPVFVCEGCFHTMPEAGSRFFMYLESDEKRYIHTSEVRSVRVGQDNEHIIQTENSTYVLSYISKQGVI
jgi:hypothetical protein